MTIIIVPTEKCNLKCYGCFEPEDQRMQGAGMKYNFEAIRKSLDEIWKGPYHGADVTLHGGECLMVPLPELDRLLGLIYNLSWDAKKGTVKGVSSIMTNGTLITDEHIKLFKKWNTYVGMSIDGPQELNVWRGPDTSNAELTKRYNEELMETVRKLRRNNIPVSLICCLHTMNAGTPEKRERLRKWLLELKELGITQGRFNPIFTDLHPEMQLDARNLSQIWINLHSWNKKYGLKWNPVVDMEEQLKGNPNHRASCSHGQCDPYETKTISVLPDGTIGLCDKTFGAGMIPRSRDGKACGRYEALSQTECAGCRLWKFCGGGCPVEAPMSDWRGKTRWCEALKITYGYIEKQLGVKAVLPVNEPQRFDEGRNAPHGDAPHGDAPHGDSLHEDAFHGDIPHGDSAHGDAPGWREEKK